MYKARNYLLQADNAVRFMRRVITEENHTERAALITGKAPEDVTPDDRALAIELDRAIGLGNVEF